MKGYMRFVVLIFAILMLLVGCNQRKKVTVIQDNQKQPTVRKPINDAPVPTEQTTIQKALISATIEDGKLHVVSDGKEFSIPTKKIAELSYTLEWDYSQDKVKDGTQSNEKIAATMESSEGKEYTLYIHKGITAFIVVNFGDKDYVFNLESKEATQEFYDQLKGTLK